ncbi:MAG: hypothetical protein AAGG75_28335 [Bacteroidota bacterium]
MFSKNYTKSAFGAGWTVGTCGASVDGGRLNGKTYDSTFGAAVTPAVF